MGFMDKAKNALTQAKDKAAGLAEQHSDKIDQGITKAGDFVDKKTGGKHADKIDQAQAKARVAADKLAAERGGVAASADPVPTDPVPTVPVPTDVPTAPVPPGPVPTEPAPTDPVPTDPVGPDDPSGTPPRPPTL